MGQFYQQKSQECFFTSLVFHLLEGEDDGGCLPQLCCPEGHLFGYSLVKRLFRCLIKNLMKKLTADAIVKKKRSRHSKSVESQ